jgi:ectoine hydroxylase-related dioxygenase (phytanoyl-CoA dioxygenase family)
MPQAQLDRPLSAPSTRKAAYESDGFVVVRALLPGGDIARAAAEAGRLLEERRDLISTRNLRCRWQNNILTGETCQFETFDPVVDLGPACRDLALHPALLTVLAELYGEQACLFKDKLIYKPPGCKGYGLHQDWIAWPGFPRSFLTVLVPLDPARIDNGCTEVFPGYHTTGSLSEEDGDYHELPASVVDESRCVPLELEPGDVAIFTGFTPHRSAPNLSERWRRQLYFSYNSLSDGGEQRTKHYEEFHVWLRKKYAEYGKTDIYFE